MSRPTKDRSLARGKAAKPFFEALRSEHTRESYERRVVTFLNYVNMPIDEFIGRAKRRPAWAQRILTNYMLKQKERYLNKQLEASSIRSLMKPLKLLVEMNDVTTINWKKISKMMPAARNYALDRAPTMEEMRQMIANSELRFQAIILTMASSGIRIGAWDYLNWGHVEPFQVDGKTVAGKLTVYAGEPEEYFTFINPEACAKLEEYIKFRQQHGETVTKDSPLARDRWRTSGTRPWQFSGDVKRPVRLQSLGVKRLFEDMMWKLGFRNEKRKRHEFSIHSIRKFFKTRAEQVMKPINVETLMGHSTGISDSYYRPTVKNLLDDYLKAVPLLTISEAEEVRQQSLVVEQKNAERLRQLEELVSQLVAEKGQQVLALDRSRK